MGLPADKAREIINKFPNTSKRELGRLLYKQNPLLFADQEAARRTIRQYTGASGKSHRRDLRVKGMIPDHLIYKPK